MHPTVKIFSDSGCESALIGCPETGAALLVDPKAGRRAVVAKAAADLGLTIAAVVDTHTHADHLSDSAHFAAHGTPVAMSRHTACRRRLRKVAHGDRIEVGRIAFEVREVPGHTPDSIALVGHGLCIAGDTLFAGSLARADFRGSDPARLFESVAREILSLPDDTVVLPGHGYRDVLFTTVGVERAKNPALRHADGAAYARALGAREGAGNSPDVDAMLRTNLEEDPVLPADPKAAAACCSAGESAAPLPRARELAPRELESLRAGFAARRAWIDVRDRFEFRASRIPGAENVPLGELGFHLADLRQRGPLALSCLGGVRSMTAARTLVYLGATEDPVSLAGGFTAWQGAGLAVD